MKQKEQFLPIKSVYPLDPDTYFLSLETTGLQPLTSAITMIGIAHVTGQTLHTIQWFHDSGLDQKEVLIAFLEAFSSCHTVITHYGNRFAIPFLEEKCQEYGLRSPFPDITSIDYFEIIKPFKKALNLSSCKQSALETYYHCPRTIKLSGKKQVSLYQDYLKDKDIKKENTLFTYNFESLQNLYTMSNLLLLHDIQLGKVAELSSEQINQHFGIYFRLPVPISQPVQISFEGIQLLIQDTIGTLLLPVDPRFGIQHHYPDVKNYYYLPMEDKAIHKSLARFVPKEHKQKATKETCYEWLFLEHPALARTDSLRQLLIDSLAYLLLMLH